MEPEHYAALLQSLRTIFADAVARHGGEIARIDGDGALCVFGYPESHEDTGRRATEAAIDIHVAVDALPAPRAGAHRIRLHSGIHAGLVLLREGDMARGRFEVLGDTTNVAARLSDAAKPGEIIVSAATLGADRHFFHTGPVRAVEVAGKASGIPALAVHGREAPATRFAARTRLGLTPFVGREVALARLHAWQADPGRPRGPALIAGPPGIGKTRLLGEFLAQAAAAGIAVYRGFCESYLGARPLQPFVQLAQSIIAANDGSIPPGIVALTSGDIGAAHEPQQIARAMSALIDAAALSPCVLAIDDWQWADGASRKLLDALLPELGPRVRVVLVSRDGSLRFENLPPSEIIFLEPLSDDEARTAAASLLSSPNPFLATEACRESGGNPLFLEELCHASRLGGRKRARPAPNAWLDMLIQARFAKLPPEQAALVRVAAIIGHAVPAWLFTAIAGVPADDPAVAALAEADFLYPGDIPGTLRFKHGIARDAIYRTIGLDERMALHRAIVEALKAEGEAGGPSAHIDALAYHCAASGDLAAAIPHAVAAGDAALAAGAVDRAQGHYRAAFEGLATMPGDDDTATLIWKLVNKYGLACITDPSPEQVPVLSNMVIRMAALGHSAALVRSKYWIGAIAYGLGNGQQSAADLEEALALARTHDETRMIPQIELKLAQSLLAAGQYARADAIFERVLPLMQAGTGRNDREALAYGLSCRGFLKADQGDFVSAHQYQCEAQALLDAAAPSIRTSCLTQMAAVSLMQGRWDEALARALECAAACEGVHAPYQAMMAGALAAFARWQITGDPGASGCLVDAADWFAVDASQQRTSLVYGWLAEIMEATGEPVRARHYAARAIARVRKGGDRLGEAAAYRAIALLAERHADRSRADRYLARAYRSAAIRHSAREAAMTDQVGAQLAARRGDDDRAASLARGAATAFEAMGAASLGARANLARYQSLTRTISEAGKA
jgi:class 3 adenylate cyclase/tetratricopeptide (TPR) repeat protein